MKNTVRLLINFVVTFLLCLPVVSQSVFENQELEKIRTNKVSGKTHQVVGGSSSYKSLYVTYNKEGLVVEETSYRSSGEVAVQRSFKYDGSGNITEYQSFDGLRSKVTYKKFVKYDANNNKINEVGFDGVDRFENKYTYDSQNRVDEIRYYTAGKLIEKRQMKYGSNHEISIYDETSSLTEKQLKILQSKLVLQESVYSAKGDEKRRVEFKYNANGDVIKEIKYFSGKLKETIEYDYEGKKLVKIFKTLPEEKKHLDREYTYSDNGLLMHEKWYDSKSKKFSSKSYTYDEDGNAIEIKSYFAMYDFSENVKINYSFY